MARAAIVDQQALYEHLRANPGFGAGLDTWWDEPAGDAPFRADYPFFDLPNLLGAPHNSSIMPGTMLAGARAARTSPVSRVALTTSQIGNHTGNRCCVIREAAIVAHVRCS